VGIVHGAHDSQLFGPKVLMWKEKCHSCVGTVHGTHNSQLFCPKVLMLEGETSYAHSLGITGLGRIF